MRAVEIRAALAEVVAAHNVRTLAFVGAHEGEEVGPLLAAGVARLVLVEPIPLLAAKLRARYADSPAVEVVQCACSDRAGTAVLNVPAKTNMASLEPLDGEQITVPTRRLDDIAPDAEAAVVDVQGHEFAVLNGAPWDSLRLVMVETLHGVEDRALSPQYDAMTDYMDLRGFREVARYTRDYDWIQRWAYGRETSTGAEVRDVVYAKAD